MGLIQRLSRRNVMRNPRRTILTVFLIGSGLTALLFTDAFVKGMIETMINISTQTFLGHGQIHHPQYRASQDVDDYMNDVDSLYAQLDELSEVKAYSPRTITGAMVASSQNVASANVFGVVPEKEAQVSLLKEAVIQGRYLTESNQDILIGQEMADILEVGLGDRIVVTVSAAHGGELSQELFRVSGIFQFNDRQMDTYLAFIHLNKSQSMLNVSGVHEIAWVFQDLQQAEDTALPIWSLKRDYEILNWRQLVPQLNSVLEMSRYSTVIVSVILFCLVSLGLINSMFMSIYERQQEFGVLLALGTRPFQIFLQIVSEGAWIGLIAALFGLLVGSGLSYWFQIHGIDYGSLEYGSITLNDPIYLIIEWRAFLELAIAIFLMTVVACVYPAIHAARLLPSFAMRKTT